MAEVAQAVVALIPSAKGFGQATQRELSGQMRGTGKKQGVGLGRRLAVGMAAGVVAAGGAGFILKSVVGEASSLEQSVGGLKAVFKGSFGEMNKQSKNAAKNLGLSKNEYNELATVLGAGLKNKGVKDYAGATQDLVGVGADLAAQFGGSTSEAVDALASAMRGESDPIEKYGISLNESAISAELARKGQDDLKGAALEQAKTQARLTLISQQSADAQGAFGRESNTLAGQQQRLGAQVDNVKAKLGKALLPVLTDGATLLNEKVVPAVSSFIEEWRNSTGVGGQVRDIVTQVGSALKSVATFLWDHKEAVAALLVAYAGFKVVMATMRAYRAVMLLVKGVQLGYAAATYGAVGASMAQTRAEKLGLVVGKAKLFFTKAVTVATKAWAVAQRVLNAVLRMNPIGLLITGLMLLVGGFILAYKKSETFRRIVDAAWRGIKKAALAVVNWFRNTAWPWMKNAFQWIGDKAKWLWKNAIKPAWAAIKSGIKATVSWIKDVGWPWIKGAFDNIKKAAGWLWDKMKWAFNKIKGGAQSFADKVKWLWGWVKRYFTQLKENAFWLWDKVKLAFNKLKDGVNAVKNAFGRAKDGIGRAWDKVYGKITSPIKKAMRWLNKNFIGKLNGLLGKIPGVSFRIPKINTKGFSGGGLLPGYTPMSRGDDQLTPMRSGEGVLVSEGLRDPQSKSMFLAANAAAKRGVPFKDFINQGYAGGGIVALGKRLQQMGYDVSEHPCVPLDATILTQRGWLKYDEVRVGDQTVGYDSETGKSTWTRVNKVLVFEDGAEVFEVSNSRWSSRSTANHRWLSESVSHGGRNPARRWMRELKDIGNESKFLLSVPDGVEGRLDVSPDEARLLAWVWGDGSIYRKDRQCQMHVYQSKAAGKAELDELCERLPVTNTGERMIGWGGEQGRATTDYYVERGFGVDLLARAGLHDKHDSSDALRDFILGLSPEARRAWLDGMVSAEGSTRGELVSIAQNEGPVLEAIILAGHLSGYRVRLHRRKGDRSRECAVTLCRPVVQRKRTQTQSLGHMPVWCVETDHGTWTMQQGEHVMLTGNSFGGVVPGAHSASGYHYKGGALDINADPWNSRFNRETPALDKLNAMLRGEGWNTIWRAPNHWDHLHVDIGNGQGGSGGGLGFLTKFLPDWAKSLVDSPMGFIKDKISGLMGKMPGGFGLAGKVLPGVVGKMASGIGRKVKDTFSLSGLMDKFLPDWLSGGDKGGGGTGRWRGTVMRALSMLGLPSSLAGTTLRRMAQESGGNPRAINNWDSNALRGTPSKGLMQVIDPTFRAYNYPGHNDIWNPLDNILASMRYALAQYGSLSAAYNRSGGYAGGGLVTPAVFDNGGTLAPGLNLVNNKLGKPESLVRPEQFLSGPITVNVIDRDGTFIERMDGRIDMARDHDDRLARRG